VIGSQFHFNLAVIVLDLLPAPGNGVILGYFFGTRHRNLPRGENLRDLSRTDAILVARFGDTGLVQGDWPVIARKSPWNQEEWPLPTFGRIFELEGQEFAWRVEYSDANLVTEVRETRVKPGQIRHLPEDSLWGDLAMQEYLTDLLTK
jgi:hypothetical protein